MNRSSRLRVILVASLNLAAILTATGRTAAGVDFAAGVDLQSDTWVASDALGRRLPTARDIGPPRPGKYVGVFYFLWLGQAGDAGTFDITKIRSRDPSAIANPKSPLWGADFVPHHWGESIFGYYRSDDESVLRKHAQMLADADVDMIVFDVTNQVTYPQSWRALCRVFDQAKRAGNRVPQIAFLCPFGDPRKVVHELWDDLYSQDLFPDLWFHWDDKPLILADPAPFGGDNERRRRTGPIDDRDERISHFFTFRKPQPDYFQGPTGPKQWGWLEVYPQHAFYKTPGVAEEVAVGVAQNAADGKLSVFTNTRSHGRSFHDGQEPGPGGRDTSGRNFAEQWWRALELDPAVVFITNWNEWIAGRFSPATMPLYGTGPVTFVDEFDAEFSRDVEPMKGGHGDNYYYQMIANIRRFKGVRTIPPVESHSIAIDGRFDDWAKVQPEFRDTIGDPVRRNHPGWGTSLHYANATGRNDIVAAKVSIDESAIAFCVRARETITSPAEPNWMLLFIDVDQNPKTGWLGYDFVVNRKMTNASTTVVERNVGGRYEWASPIELPIGRAGSELELAIPRSILGITTLPAAIDFKWADNIQQTGNWSDFTLNGDAAPNDRFNYRAHFGNAAP
jgi:hypothetical protein